MISIAPSLPEGWDKLRFRYIASTVKGRLPAKSDDDVAGTDSLPYLSMEYLRGDSEAMTFVSPAGMITADDRDVLLLWDGSNAGEFLRSKLGAVSSTVALVRPIEFDQKFLFWLCKTAEPVLKTFTNGMGIPHVDGEFLKDLVLPYPKEAATRERIADYLDRETARIDALIAEKERMLALLEEKRAALISRVVTRGLDPNAPLKPSGQEWLGEIPAHWEVRTLKQASSRIDTGTTPAASFMDGSLLSDFTWFTPSDFEHGGVIAESNRKIPQEAVDEGEAKVFPAHSLMVIGIGATLGKVASSRARFSANQQINVITPLESVRWDYLLYVLQGYEHVFRAHANSATLPILNQERLGVIRVLVPPSAEQDAIVTRLNDFRAEYAEVSQLLGNSISLLKERRAALITAAVTGQIPLAEMRA